MWSWCRSITSRAKLLSWRARASSQPWEKHVTPAALPVKSSPRTDSRPTHATPSLRSSTGNRVCGSEQSHEFRKARSETALAPFETGFIGHCLAEHSDDQRRHEVDGFF